MPIRLACDKLTTRRHDDVISGMPEIPGSDVICRRTVGVWGLSAGARSDGDDELGVDVRESGELGLVEVHDEQLVGRRQLGSLACELAVKVANVFHRFLRTLHTLVPFTSIYIFSHTG